MSIDSDHTFCRLMLKDVRNELTSEQRKRLVGASSYYRAHIGGEFRVMSEDFYWHGSSDCSWDARQQGISAWLEYNYPEK